MLFTIVESCSYVTKVSKFIDIECNDQRSRQAFLRELEDMNIYDKLEQSVDIAILMIIMIVSLH